MTQAELTNYIKQEINDRLRKFRIPPMEFVQKQEGENIVLKWTAKTENSILITKDTKIIENDNIIEDVDDFLSKRVSRTKRMFDMICRTKYSISLSENETKDYENICDSIKAKYGFLNLELLTIADAYESFEAHVKKMEENRTEEQFRALFRNENLSYPFVLGFSIGDYKAEEFSEDIKNNLLSKHDDVFNEGLDQLFAEAKSRFQLINAFISDVKKFDLNLRGSLENVLSSSKQYREYVKQVATQYESSYFQQYLDMMNLDDVIEKKFSNLKRILDGDLTWSELN